jgi:DNA-binding MarR family transcriptional regulator
MATGTRIQRWTFLTNHARVLICAGRWPDARVRDIAKQVDITERQVISILNDLETAGYLSRERVGRRNHYRINRHARFRQESEGLRPSRTLRRASTA